MSRFEPNSHPRRPKGPAWRKIRSSPVYAGHTIKPLRNRSLSRAPAVSDRIEAHGSRRAPLPAFHRDEGSPSFEQAKRGCGRKSLPSFRVFGVRARTCQQRPARPEAGCLSAPVRLAKSKNRAAARPAKCPKILRSRPKLGPIRAQWPRGAHYTSPPPSVQVPGDPGLR